MSTSYLSAVAARSTDARITREANHGVRPPYPSGKTIVEILCEQVVQTPGALALVVPEGDVDEDRLELSYTSMWAMITQVAQALVAARPSGDCDWVIIVLPQGLQQVIAVWGTLRSGCGYVPIDANTHSARLRILFEETQPCLAIGEAGDGIPLADVAAEFGVRVGTFPNGARAGLTIAAQPRPTTAATPLLWPTPNANALLLFSSGSTGTPKGIVYDHRWLMGGSFFVACDLELTERSRCLLRCSYVWSVSLYDLFPANMVGGTLVIPPRGGHLNVQYALSLHIHPFAAVRVTMTTLCYCPCDNDDPLLLSV